VGGFFTASVQSSGSLLRSSVRRSLQLLADELEAPVALPAFPIINPTPPKATTVVQETPRGSSSRALVPRELRDSVRESIDLYQGLLTARGILEPPSLGLVALWEAAGDETQTPSGALLFGTGSEADDISTATSSDDELSGSDEYSFEDTPLWTAEVHLEDAENSDLQQQRNEGAGPSADTESEEPPEALAARSTTSPAPPAWRPFVVPPLKLDDTRRSLMAELGAALTARRNAGTERSAVAPRAASDDDDLSGSIGSSNRQQHMTEAGNRAPRDNEVEHAAIEDAVAEQTASASAATGHFRPPLPAGTKKLRLKKNAGRLFRRILGK
jgi:hypothetical protein